MSGAMYLLSGFAEDSTVSSCVKFQEEPADMNFENAFALLAGMCKEEAEIDVVEIDAFILLAGMAKEETYKVTCLYDYGQDFDAWSLLAGMAEEKVVAKKKTQVLDGCVHTGIDVWELLACMCKGKEVVAEVDPFALLDGMAMEETYKVTCLYDYGQEFEAWSMLAGMAGEHVAKQRATCLYDYGQEFDAWSMLAGMAGQQIEKTQLTCLYDYGQVFDAWSMLAGMAREKVAKTQQADFEVFPLLAGMAMQTTYTLDCVKQLVIEERDDFAGQIDALGLLAGMARRWPMLHILEESDGYEGDADPFLLLEGMAYKNFCKKGEGQEDDGDDSTTEGDDDAAAMALERSASYGSSAFPSPLASGPGLERQLSWESRFSEDPATATHLSEGALSECPFGSLQENAELGCMKFTDSGAVDVFGMLAGTATTKNDTDDDMDDVLHMLGGMALQRTYNVTCYWDQARDEESGGEFDVFKLLSGMAYSVNEDFDVFDFLEGMALEKVYKDDGETMATGVNEGGVPDVDVWALLSGMAQEEAN